MYTSLAEDNDGLNGRVGELEAENERLKKHLRDANRGAELNSKVNALLIDEQDALRTRIAELEALLKDAEDWLDGDVDMALVLDIRAALAKEEE